MRGATHFFPISSAKEVLTKSCITLRDTILKTVCKCVADANQKLQDMKVPVCTQESLQDFAADMTSQKCTMVTDAVTDGEKIWDHVDGLSKSWGLEVDALYEGSTQLRELLDTLYKAVFTAFAAKCIVSKSAQKRLAAASDQAKKALAFADTHRVVLDGFIVAQLKNIRDGKPPQCQV